MGDHTFNVPPNFRLDDGHVVEMEINQVIVECIPNPKNAPIYDEGTPFVGRKIPFCLIKAYRVKEFEGRDDCRVLFQTLEATSDYDRIGFSFTYELEQLTEKVKREIKQSVKKALETGKITYKLIILPFPNFNAVWKERVKPFAVEICDSYSDRLLVCDIKQMIEGVDEALYYEQSPHPHLEKCLGVLASKEHLEYIRKEFGLEWVGYLKKFAAMLEQLSKLDCVAAT